MQITVKQTVTFLLSYLSLPLDLTSSLTIFRHQTLPSSAPYVRDNVRSSGRSDGRSSIPVRVSKRPVHQPFRESMLGIVGLFQIEYSFHDGQIRSYISSSKSFVVFSLTILFDDNFLYLSVIVAYDINSFLYFTLISL